MSKITIDDRLVKDNEFNFTHSNGDRVFVFKNVKYKGDSNLKHMKFETVSFEDNKDLLSVFMKEEYAVLYEELLTLWDREEDFYAFNSRWQSLLSVENRKFNLAKFRGDFAELIFLKVYGGIKKEDKAESDIMLGDIQYEVKSVSNHSYNITISHRQLVNDNPVALFLLKESNDESFNIIQLASQLYGNGYDKFIEHIEKKYNHDFFLTKKFKVENGKNLVKPIEAKENVKFFKSATYVLHCDWENLKDIKV